MCGKTGNTANLNKSNTLIVLIDNRFNINTWKYKSKETKYF